MADEIMAVLDALRKATAEGLVAQFAFSRPRRRSRIAG
jgi:hypothetical protein